MATKKKDLWFVNKTYGWGWTPVTWQGWLVTIFFVSLIVKEALMIDKNLPDFEAVGIFLPKVFVYIVLLLLICLNKGEKPRWRWGK